MKKTLPIGFLFTISLMSAEPINAAQTVDVEQSDARDSGQGEEPQKVALPLTFSSKHREFEGERESDLDANMTHTFQSEMPPDLFQSLL